MGPESSPQGLTEDNASLEVRRFLRTAQNGLQCHRSELSVACGAKKQGHTIVFCICEWHPYSEQPFQSNRPTGNSGNPEWPLQYLFTMLILVPLNYSRHLTLKLADQFELTMGAVC